MSSWPGPTRASAPDTSWRSRCRRRARRCAAWSSPATGAPATSSSPTGGSCRRERRPSASRVRSWRSRCPSSPRPTGVSKRRRGSRPGPAQPYRDRAPGRTHRRPAALCHLWCAGGRARTGVVPAARALPEAVRPVAVAIEERNGGPAVVVEMAAPPQAVAELDGEPVTAQAVTVVVGGALNAGAERVVADPARPRAPSASTARS